MRRILFLLAPLVVGSSTAQPFDRGEEFRGILDAYHETRKFMGSVVVSVDGREVFAASAGFANLEHARPDRETTVYKVGSITKSMTASAILKLQEQGKLAVTDHVGKFLPAYPNGKNITLHHLLTHTSGLANYTSAPDFASLQVQGITIDQLIEKFKFLPASFAPGEKFEYSNSGYVLLGKIVELASGMSYQQYLRRELFSPLHLERTGFHGNREGSVDVAGGYVVTPEGFRPADPIDMTLAGAAGGASSTASEMARWLPGLLSGRVLSAGSVAAMVGPHVDTRTGTPGFTSYGYGLGSGELFGRQVVSHGGDINGFSSVVAYFPQEKLSVCVLSNTAGPAAQLLALDVIRAFFGIPYDLPVDVVSVKVEEHDLARYVGSYSSGPSGMLFEVGRDGRQLTVELPGQGRFALTATGPSTFRLPAFGVTLEFRGVGDVDVVVTQNGRRVTVQKQRTGGR